MEKIERYYMSELMVINGVLHHKVYDRKTGKHFIIEDELIDDEFIKEMIFKNEMSPYNPTITEK